MDDISMLLGGLSELRPIDEHVMFVQARFWKKACNLTSQLT